MYPEIEEQIAALQKNLHEFIRCIEVRLEQSECDALADASLRRSIHQELRR